MAPQVPFPPAPPAEIQMNDYAQLIGFAHDY